MQLSDIPIKIFADGADLAHIAFFANMLGIAGFTTNPTLMRKAGVTNYRDFALAALKIIGEKPISFEVFADDMEAMHRQALEISTWGENVYVKIPVTSTSGDFVGPLLRDLSTRHVKLNVTAVFTRAQITQVIRCLNPNTPAIISIFAGRIADTGVNPAPIIRFARSLVDKMPYEILWASPRQVLDIFNAFNSGAHIITVSEDLLKKTHLLGRDLEEYSLETVTMFFDDAKSAGYTLDPGPPEVGDQLGR